MKKSIICLVLFLGVASFIFSQNNEDKLKFSEMTANIGKGAFTSGLDITLKFKAEKGFLEITGNHERGYMVYCRKFPLSIRAGISGGFFKNMPWAGPYVLIVPTKFLSFLYWHGWGAGEPEKPGTEIREMFKCAGVFLNFKGFNFGFVANNFMGEKTLLPGVSYAVSINHQFKCFVGVDYKTSEDEPLFRIGFSYFPEK